MPGIYDTVTRAERVKIEDAGRKRREFTVEADGLLAICVQHGLDHLMGVVFCQTFALKLNKVRLRPN